MSSIVVVLSAAASALLVQPHYHGVQTSRTRVATSPVCDLTTGTKRESRFAPIVEFSPGKRYREMAQSGEKFYQGRDESSVAALKKAMGDVGNRKIVVITGCSSGLGFFCVKHLLKESRDGYYVVAAVRDPAKMDEEAESLGISKKDYTAVELQLASFESVQDFANDLKSALPGGKLDRLVCNAAVYLPTDPVPRWTDDGFEMSLQVNHLSHFLLVQLLLPALKKADKPRCCIVGSVTGNKNTVAGSLVKPVADVGDLSGLKAGAGQTMVDGAKKFDGAKAYKDAKALNMMTVLELHRRLHDETGITFNSMYPGCIASTNLLYVSASHARRVGGSTFRCHYHHAHARARLLSAHCPICRTGSTSHKRAALRSREKREWFRYFFFPTLMKAIGSYVTQPEAGERLASVITDDITEKSGVYWSWNGNAKKIGIGNAGGSGGEIFENEFSSMCRDAKNGALSWEYSMEAVKDFL